MSEIVDIAALASEVPDMAAMRVFDERDQWKTRALKAEEALRVSGTLERIAKAELADPASDDLTIPLAIELAECQARALKAEAECEIAISGMASEFKLRAAEHAARLKAEADSAQWARSASQATAARLKAEEALRVVVESGANSYRSSQYRFKDVTIARSAYDAASTALSPASAKATAGEEKGE